MCSSLICFQLNFLNFCWLHFEHVHFLFYHSSKYFYLIFVVLFLLAVLLYQHFAYLIHFSLFLFLWSDEWVNKVYMGHKSCMFCSTCTLGQICRNLQCKLIFLCNHFLRNGLHVQRQKKKNLVTKLMIHVCLKMHVLAFQEVFFHW